MWDMCLPERLLVSQKWECDKYAYVLNEIRITYVAIDINGVLKPLK